MPENDDLDPGASTQMGEAFVDRADPEPSRSSGMRVALVAAAVVVLVIAVALAWLLFG